MQQPFVSLLRNITFRFFGSWNGNENEASPLPVYRVASTKGMPSGSAIAKIIVGSLGMELSFGVLLTACLMTLFANVLSKKETIFERNFRELHSEPPIPIPRSHASVQTLWIDQKLDNFNDSNIETWKMRYLANGEFFKEGAPVFVVVGGEWAISEGYLVSGHLYDIAKKHNGYLFYTEHRYYGESRPTSDLSTENLKYLDVKQALADLAHFIRTMKATMPGMASSKFILRGCSYSATMVTWFRKLYPDLAVGAWALSGPLLAEVEFEEYAEELGKSIRKVGGERCYDRIKNAFNELQSMIDNNRSAEVIKLLKICNNFNATNDMDVSSLFKELDIQISVLVQYKGEEKIEKACRKIMVGDDDVAGLVTYILESFEDNCTDFSYKGTMAPIFNLNYTDNVARQFIYQTCNEYGWFQTTGSRNQPFGTKSPLSYFTRQCADLYGERFTNEFIHKQVMETNNIFGGLQPNVENVYFTHGELDPWRALGLQDGNLVTIIPMSSHCGDGASLSDADTPEMRAAKKRIAELVRQWVK